MRTLKFIVDGQEIQQDPSWDFSRLVPGSEKYIKAEFSFSPEWKKRVKVARFFSALGREYEPQALMDGRTCLIPSEALKKRVFKVQVMGKEDKSKILTNKVEVKQNGGRT